MDYLFVRLSLDYSYAALSIMLRGIYRNLLIELLFVRSYRSWQWILAGHLCRQYFLVCDKAEVVVALQIQVYPQVHSARVSAVTKISLTHFYR